MARRDGSLMRRWFWSMYIHRNRCDACQIRLVGLLLNFSSSHIESFTLLIARSYKLAQWHPQVPRPLPCDLLVLLLATSLRRCAVDKNIATIRIEQGLARIVVLKPVADSIVENHLLCFQGIAMRWVVLATVHALCPCDNRLHN